MNSLGDSFVVAAWPELPEAIRAGIVAIVEAASRSNEEQATPGYIGTSPPVAVGPFQQSSPKSVTVGI
jgi:hypothetical protein